MTPENINFDELKKAWLAMGEILGMQSTQNDNPENLNNKKTALDNLRDRYRSFWTMSLIMTFISLILFPILFTKVVIFDKPVGVYLGTAYAIYFLIAFIMDHWLWTCIGKIDPLHMSISQVAEKSMSYRKRHLQFMFILIPIAIALFGFTGYVFSSDIFFLSGMGVGVICGLILGSIQLRRFMNDYRKLSE